MNLFSPVLAVLAGFVIGSGVMLCLTSFPETGNEPIRHNRVSVSVEGMSPKDLFACLYLCKSGSSKPDAEAAYNFANMVMEVRKKK